MSASDPWGAEGMRATLERVVQRGLRGLDNATAPPPAVGMTPKDLVHARGTLRLYRYRPVAQEVYRVPLLLVMATTNPGYVFDLSPGQSLVEFLLVQGYDLFLLDWHPPRDDERRLRLEDYVQDFLPDCVAKVARETGENELTIIGYCMGGVLSVLYAALHAPGPLKNLVCLTTGVDWSQMGLFSTWADQRSFDVDALVEAVGNISPDMIFASFEMLRPASRAAGQAQLWEKIWDDSYVKSYRLFDRWARDTKPLPGELFRQIVKELIWQNRLARNTLILGGHAVDLGNITVPFLHVVAEHDHIVPYAAAKPLIAMVGSADKEELMLKGGHVSLVAGPSARRRLWPKLDTWLQERST